jgi:enamine deaminase RidA (YjgF/YER057c/UK114 family)
MTLMPPYYPGETMLMNLNSVWSERSSASASLGVVLKALEESARLPVWAVLYASREEADNLLPELRNAGAWTRWPLMVLITPGAGEQGGFQACSVAETTALTPLCDAERVVGFGWSDGDGRRRVSLCGLTPQAGDTPEEGTARVLARAGELLAEAGLAWTDVYRTWFYNDRILDWYDGFNRVRTAAYRAERMDFRRAPASTGIGLANGEGAAVTLGLLAASPHIEPGPVVSPLQNAAMNYGSLFSRATEETEGELRRLWVSGTADIDEAGRTCHLGDFEAQTIRTYEIVKAILVSRGMDWTDVCRATAYVREPADIERHAALVARGLIPALEAVVIPATVCRDNLLFEIELDAIL